MKVHACAAVLFLFTAKAFATTPEASLNDEGSTASIPGPAEIRQQLDQTQQILREQAEMLRAMRQELDRQGREIESLQQRINQEAPAAAPGDSGESAARLQTAVLSLREPARLVLVRPIIPAKVRETAQPDVKVGQLAFHIGNATFTPSGWVDFTAYLRSTDVGSGIGTNFLSIPYSNTPQGGLSETRLTAQSSRFAVRVD